MSLRRSARIQSSKPDDTHSLDSQDTPGTKSLQNVTDAQKRRGKRTRKEVVPDTASDVEPKDNTTAKLSKKRTKSASKDGISTSDQAQVPERKRRKTTATAGVAEPAASTPTPTAANLMASSPAADASTPHPRPAEPHATNAPVKTEDGSRVTVYPAKNSTEVASTPNELLPAPTTTTEDLLARAEAHLISVDPRFKGVIEKHPCRLFSPEGLQEEVDPFKSLVSGIIAQQVSGAAAKSIQARFIGLFADDTDAPHPPTAFPSPAAVAAADIPRLRSAGLSQRKAEYVQGVAGQFARGELSAAALARASDDEVLAMLTAVRGLGRWSVEMFMCFALKRCDVFSTGDLGVQRGMAAWLGRDVSKLKAKGGTNKWKYMSEREMLEHSAPYAPFRSLFMWYMWRVEDVDISALQG